MAIKISRRKLAEYTADRLIKKDSSVIKELAAYLVENGRQRELSLIVRDVENALAQRGILIADVAAAYQIDQDLEKQIVDFIKQNTDAKEVQLRKAEDKALIGGIKLETPFGDLDTSISGKLANIKNNYLRER